jgi:spore germination protein GerM
MRKVLAFFFTLILILGFTACAGPSQSPENGQNKTDEIVDPTPQVAEKEVNLYFANEDYVVTGDEQLEKLKAEKRVLQYGEDMSLEETIVRELMKGPQSEGLSTEIPSTVKLIGVRVDNGTAFVDFAQEGLHGGSLQEFFTIEQIVRSLIELDSVDKIQFLIEGQKAESLMGHMSIYEPLN